MLGGSRADDRLLDRGWWRHVVQDAMAAFALDDLFVGANVLEDRRAQADVAGGTEALARGGGHRHALSYSGDLFEQRDEPRLEAREDLAPLLAGARERRFDADEILRQ